MAFTSPAKATFFLIMGGKYANQAFTAFIPSAGASQFSNPQQYEGKPWLCLAKLLCIEASRRLLSQTSRRFLLNNLGPRRSAFRCAGG
jgi:hypothetical protein